MGLLDGPLKGRRGVVLLIVIGVVAAALGTVVAIRTWGDQPADDAASDRANGSGATLVRVVSRPGGFSVEVPDELVGDQVGRGVKLTTRRGDVVITVAPSPSGGLGPGHDSTLEAIRATYTEMRVDEEVGTTMGGLEARRSVGAVRRERGDQVIFSVTTAAEGSRAWSVVMFAARDIEPARLERYYQPVLDGFSVLQ